MQHVTPSTPSKNIFRYRGYMEIEFYQIYGIFSREIRMEGDEDRESCV